MKNELNFLSTIESIAEKDTRYKSEAYLFVISALNFTVSRLKVRRHVSGKELLEGIRLYAIGQFGSMSRIVFEHWGIKSCEEFGNIVFNMVNAKLLSKTETDSIEDFKDSYDFKEAFDRAAEYKLL